MILVVLPYWHRKFASVVLVVSTWLLTGGVQCSSSMCSLRIRVGSTSCPAGRGRRARRPDGAPGGGGEPTPPCSASLREESETLKVYLFQHSLSGESIRFVSVCNNSGTVNCLICQLTCLRRLYISIFKRHTLELFENYVFFSPSGWQQC